MDILTNIDNQYVSMDSYDEYNDTMNTGYLMINDGKEMYSVFFICNENEESEIFTSMDKEFENEDFFNIMKFSDSNGIVWLEIDNEEGDIIAYSNEDNESEEANNYYNDDINDFINDLKQLEASDIVKTFIFKNTKENKLYIKNNNDLDEIYLSLNKLGK